VQPGFDEAHGKALARQDQKKTSSAVLSRRSHEKKAELTRYEYVVEGSQNLSHQSHCCGVSRRSAAL